MDELADRVMVDLVRKASGDCVTITKRVVDLCEHPADRAKVVTGVSLTMMTFAASILETIARSDPAFSQTDRNEIVRGAMTMLFDKAMADAVLLVDGALPRPGATH